MSRGREPRYRPRCRTNRGVTVCRMPRHKKPRYCGIMPCIPPGYYRPNTSKKSTNEMIPEPKPKLKLQIFKSYTRV